MCLLSLANLVKLQPHCRVLCKLYVGLLLPLLWAECGSDQKGSRIVIKRKVFVEMCLQGWDVVSIMSELVHTPFKSRYITTYLSWKESQQILRKWRELETWLKVYSEPRKPLWNTVPCTSGILWRCTKRAYRISFKGLIEQIEMLIRNLSYEILMSYVPSQAILDLIKALCNESRFWNATKTKNWDQDNMFANRKKVCPAQLCRVKMKSQMNTN